MTQHRGDSSGGGQGGDGPQRRPQLHLTSRPGGDRPSAIDGPFAIERLTSLSYDLNNLLDGSIRCMVLARRAAALLPATSVEAETVRRHLDVATLAMERMGDLVQAAMRGSSSPVGSAGLNPTQPISIDEAVRHAIEVLAPEAHERHVRVMIRVDSSAAALPVGPLYSVVLNGLKNAIEAIPSDRPGCVDVDVMTVADAAASADGITFVMIVIRDDGVGLDDEACERAFTFGYTTKGTADHGVGRGVGLSLARELVRERGGSIELVPRRMGADGRGAELRVLFPFATTRT